MRFEDMARHPTVQRFAEPIVQAALLRLDKVNDLPGSGLGGSQAWAGHKPPP